MRNIVEIGDDKLRKHCKNVEKFGPRLKTLLKDMADTMYKNNGVGLAAPQVGILKRVCVVDVEERLYELVNPEIVCQEGEQSGPEGCLSIPGRVAQVRRPMKVIVKAQDAQGEPVEVVGEGLLARALCHEIDHLNGVLYIDIMDHELTMEDENDPQDSEEGAQHNAEIKAQPKPAASKGTPHD